MSDQLTEEDFANMKAERDEALLSMDREKILAYGDKWGADFRRFLPNREQWFWASVHIARTGAKSLPMEERVKSKQWLEARGLKSIDDGDVTLPGEEADAQA